MSPAARKFLVIIIVLSVLIISVFYAYKQSQFKQPEQSPSSDTQQAPPDTQDQTPAKPVTLKDLPASPTAKELRSFVENVQQTAQDSETLEINNKCEGNPFTFKVKENTKFNIKNTDSVEHTVSIAVGHVYKVGAGKTVTANGFTDAAIYNYSCATPLGQTNINAGSVYVTK